MFRARRAVEEIPCAKPTLLALDEQGALAGDGEEALLLVLPVVEPVALAGRKHMQPHAELLERRGAALEEAFRAGGLPCPSSVTSH